MLGENNVQVVFVRRNYEQVTYSGENIMYVQVHMSGENAHEISSLSALHNMRALLSPYYFLDRFC